MKTTANWYGLYQIGDHLRSQFSEVFTSSNRLGIMRTTYGEMAEWLKAPVLKTGIR